MKFILSILSVAFFINACQSTDNPRKLASNELTPQVAESNETTWNKYCLAPGGAQSADVPTPNMENELVKNVYETFKHVKPQSFYLYPAILKVYGLKSEKTPEKISENFLVYLCGEFRDRASLIEAKLMWIKNFNKLSPTKITSVNVNTDNIWSQMSANDYKKYIGITDKLWTAKKEQLKKENKFLLDIGSNHKRIEAPVPGTSVCETKFIFKAYLKNQKKAENTFSNLEDHNKRLDAFIKNRNCSKEDIADYYDFRGDSNFKPNSPESNGMIWYTMLMANGCKNTKEAKENSGLTNEICEDYFKNPFQRRWSAAKAGMATWMLHSENYESTFKNTRSTFNVLPKVINSDSSTQKPFSFSTENEKGLENFVLQNNQDHFFNRPDLGFNAALEGKDQLQKADFIYARLRNAVNRHTDWYASGWDDGRGTDRSIKTQAYSPFVASSYEPSKSDGFTACGITVNCPPDGFRHWMFVFRIKGSNLYSTLNAQNAEPLDFEKMWFDETSLGTVGLAKAERAWDRLGTAMEDELKGGAILYLHHITTEDYKVVLNDNLTYDELMKSDMPNLEGAQLIAKRDMLQEDQSSYQCSIYKKEGTVIKQSVTHWEDLSFVNPSRHLEFNNFVKKVRAQNKNTLKINSLSKKEYFLNNRDLYNSEKGERSYLVYEDGKEIPLLSLKGKTASFSFDKVSSASLARSIDILCDKN